MLADRIGGLYLKTSLPPGIFSVCQRFIKKALAQLKNRDHAGTALYTQRAKKLDKCTIPRSIAACPHILQFDRIFYPSVYFAAACPRICLATIFIPCFLWPLALQQT